jgi:hypothetical protein
MLKLGIAFLSSDPLVVVLQQLCRSLLGGRQAGRAFAHVAQERLADQLGQSSVARGLDLLGGRGAQRYGTDLRHRRRWQGIDS